MDIYIYIKTEEGPLYIYIYEGSQYIDSKFRNLGSWVVGVRLSNEELRNS
jgi:hypothetical protein